MAAGLPGRQHRLQALRTAVPKDTESTLVYLWQKAFRIWAVLMCRRQGGLVETMPGSQLTWLRWPTAGKAYRRINRARQLAPA